MPTIRSIAILFHERLRHAATTGYRIWSLVENWRARGIRVDAVYGTSREIDADLLIPHVDLSYTPDAYWNLIQRHPNVVNRRVRDIRKRTLSAILVQRDDAWDGPVIVKTNMNCRGLMDAWLDGGERWRGLFGGGFTRRLVSLPGLDALRFGSARTLGRYHIFERRRDVPPRVWNNPALVVERFVPELRDDGRYVLRNWTFFGSYEHTRLFVGPDPWVKGANSEMLRVEVPPPEAIARARERIGLDYGKIDYVVHDGEPYLLDVSPAPGMTGRDMPGRQQRALRMSEGLEWYEREAR